MTYTMAIRKILDWLIGMTLVAVAITGSVIAGPTHCGMFDCDTPLDTSTINDLR